MTNRSFRATLASMRPFTISLACLALFACGPTLVGDYPRGPVTVSPSPTPLGWQHVDEPTWFAASMPGAPKTTFETIPMEGARIQVKALSASDGRGVWTWIRYFEVNNLTTMLDAETLIRAARADFLSIGGVHFLRDEPRRPQGPVLDFVCGVDPHSALDLSAEPMVARVRAYSHTGTSSRITFVIAVWPEGASDEAARAFFEAFTLTG